MVQINKLQIQLNILLDHCLSESAKEEYEDFLNDPKKKAMMASIMHKRGVFEHVKSKMLIKESIFNGSLRNDEERYMWDCIQKRGGL